MSVDDSVRFYPELHHISEGGSWDSIQRIGLRTTRQLLDESGADAAARRVRSLATGQLRGVPLADPYART